MTQENNSIKISEETQIDLPATRRCIVFEKRDWERIKRMVRQINDSYNRWENSAWALISLAFASLFSYFAENDTSKLKPLFLMGFFMLLIVGLILFFVSYYISKSLSKSKKDVLFEMDDIESNVKAVSNNRATYYNQLEIISATYGTEEKNIDVSKILNGKIQDGKVNIKVSNNEMGEDPHIGVVKKLNIKYNHLGEVMEKSIAEGQELIIP